jgi:hypothetical protein
MARKTLDPNNLTVDFKQLMRLSIQDRVNFFRQGGASYFESLTPTQLAQLFPRYYQQALPDIGRAVSGGTRGAGGGGGGGGGVSTGTAAPSARTGVNISPPSSSVAPSTGSTPRVSQTSSVNSFREYLNQLERQQTQQGQTFEKSNSLDLTKASTQIKMKEVYSAFKKLGYSDTGARVMVTEVYRENSYKNNMLFGTHKDPHNGQLNGGLLSMSGVRYNSMMDYLKNKGLVDANGNIQQSRASIQAMAEWTDNEIKSGTHRGISPNPELHEKFRNSNINEDELHKDVGKNYIKWRVDDPKYKSGWNNIRFAEQMFSKIDLTEKSTDGKSQYTFNTDRPTSTEQMRELLKKSPDTVHYVGANMDSEDYKTTVDNYKKLTPEEQSRIKLAGYTYGARSHDKFPEEQRDIQKRMRESGLTADQYTNQGGFVDYSWKKQILSHGKQFAPKMIEFDNTNFGKGEEKAFEAYLLKHFQNEQKHRVKVDLVAKNLDKEQYAIYDRLVKEGKIREGMFRTAVSESIYAPGFQSGNPSWVKAAQERGLPVADLRGTQNESYFGSVMMSAEPIQIVGPVKPLPQEILNNSIYQKYLEQIPTSKREEFTNQLSRLVADGKIQHDDAINRMRTELTQQQQVTPTQTTGAPEKIVEPQKTSSAPGGIVSPVTGFYAKKGASNVYGASRSGGGRAHSGIDWQAENGSSVHAMTGGTILYSGNNRGYNANIVVKGDDGVIRRYAAHGSVINKKIGSRVEQGEEIGKIGSGHLHYEEVHPKLSNGKSNPVYNEFIKKPGKFVSTSYQRGTTDPSTTLGLNPGTKVEGGKVIVAPKQEEAPKAEPVSSAPVSPTDPNMRLGTAPSPPPAVPAQPAQPAATATAQPAPAPVPVPPAPAAQTTPAAPAPATTPPPAATATATPQSATQPAQSTAATATAQPEPPPKDNEYGGEYQATSEDMAVVNTRTGKPEFTFNRDEQLSLQDGRLKVTPENRTNPDQLKPVNQFAENQQQPQSSYENAAGMFSGIQPQSYSTSTPPSSSNFSDRLHPASMPQNDGITRAMAQSIGFHDPVGSNYGYGTAAGIRNGFDTTVNV